MERQRQDERPFDKAIRLYGGVHVEWRKEGEEKVFYALVPVLGGWAYGTGETADEAIRDALH